MGNNERISGRSKDMVGNVSTSLSAYAQEKGLKAMFWPTTESLTTTWRLEKSIQVKIKSHMKPRKQHCRISMRY